MRRVGVVGVGTIPYKERYDDLTFRGMAFEVTRKALREAGLTKDDIDSVVYSIYSDVQQRQQMSDLYIHDYLGMNGKPSLRISGAASTGGHALRAAYMEIASGYSDIVLVVGSQKATELFDYDTGQRGDALINAFRISIDTTWLLPYLTQPATFLNLFINAHMEKYGNPTLSQLAEVSVKNHDNACLNPEAQLKMKLSVEDVMNSRIVSWPSTLYQCCLYSEGAAALILAAEDVARSLAQSPIWLTGLGSSDDLTTRMVPNSFTRLYSVEKAAERAYEMSGIKNPRQEIDVVEVNDIVTGIEILSYESLGLAELGKGGELVDEGVVYLDGELPVNPSGGRTACGHVASVSELYQVASVVRQLREEAGDIQVNLQNGIGIAAFSCGIASQSDVVVLQREE